MKFVLEGAALPTFLLDNFKNAFGEGGDFSVRFSAPKTCVFENIQRNKKIDALLPLAFNEKLNWAFLPNSVKFSDFALFAFDMDSTLITVECIDELADCAGKKAEVAMITERAMAGEIDYAQSLKERLKCLAGLDARVLSEVYEKRVKVQAGVVELMGKIHQHQSRSVILSGGFTYFTERLRIEYGFDFATSNILEVSGGRLTGKVKGEIVDSQKKRFYLEQYAAQNNIPHEKIVAVGDGANDWAMMQSAGLSVAFHGKETLRYKTDIAINFGGHDVLFDFLEL